MTIRNCADGRRAIERSHQWRYWSPVLIAALIGWAATEGMAPAQQRSGSEVPPVVSAPLSQAAGAESPVVTDLASNGIPLVAHRAYRQAAGRLAEEKPHCGIDWALIAAIGRVETDHGRFGGSQLRADGFTSKPIRGLPLDGSNDTAWIADTDGGRLDGDPALDRAVGPMQFIPSTWRSVGAGGHPDNIVHATAGTGRYLCGNGEDLRTEPGQRVAVFRYNNSAKYVDLVLRVAAAYRAGRGAVLPPADSAAGRADHGEPVLDVTRPRTAAPASAAPPPLHVPAVEERTAPSGPEVPVAPNPDPIEPAPAAPTADSDVPELDVLPPPSVPVIQSPSAAQTLLPADPSASPADGEHQHDEGVRDGSPVESTSLPTTADGTADELVVDSGRVALPDCPVGAAIEIRNQDGAPLAERNVDAEQHLDVRGLLADGVVVERRGCETIRPRKR